MSLEEEKEEREDMELKTLDHALLPPQSPTHQLLSTPSKYSLSSGAAHSNTSPSSITLSRRSRPNVSASSSNSYSPSELCHRSPWHDDIINIDLPSINPSDHIKSLLSQLSSSISAMKPAFAHLQATLRAYNGGKGSTSAVTSSPPAISAEKVMVEELQRLSDLHIWLYSALQEHGWIKQDMNGSPESECMQEYVCGSADKPQDGMLVKSYEGIISRFYDEIRKKDAVAGALKETLAKSILKGEKLERRVKFLEAKLSLK